MVVEILLLATMFSAAEREFGHLDCAGGDFSKLSAELAGQDDGVTKRAYDRPRFACV